MCRFVPLRLAEPVPRPHEPPGFELAANWSAYWCFEDRREPRWQVRSSRPLAKESRPRWRLRAAPRSGAEAVMCWSRYLVPRCLAATKNSIVVALPLNSQCTGEALVGLMPAGYTQPLSVFDRGLQLLLWIGEGSRDGRIQPLLVASQCFVALLRERMNQITDQGFHATHSLYAGRAAETNLIESQS